MGVMEDRHRMIASGGGLLPPGYAQMTYIRATGNQDGTAGAYIDTGIALHRGYVVAIDIEIDTTAANFAYWGYRWQGSYSDPYQCYIQTTGGSRRVFFGTNFRGAGNDDVFPFDQRFVIVIDSASGTVTVNGQAVTLNVDLANIADESGSTVKNPYLGAFNNVTYAATTNTAAKYYGYKVTENGVLVQRFIPARNSSGVYGMYDTVSRTFFTSGNSYPFTGA